MPDNMQLQRFELKYLVTEDVARSVREFVRCYLDIDEYGATLPDLSYPVHSLYLDSDDLKLYHATINGEKNRFKLRLRYYEERGNAPVFFEIKRRTNSTISKQRGGVKREIVSHLLRGHLPAPEHLISKEPKHFVALQNFCRLMQNIQAKPKAHIFYMREAWISRMDNSVRVTMDRKVMCDPDPTARLLTSIANEHSIWGKEIILELKFTTRFPDWFKELVRIFDLTQCGAAKYVEGVDTVGRHAINGAFAFDGLMSFDKLHVSATPAVAKPLAGVLETRKD
jgi:hypothetical protein